MDRSEAGGKLYRRRVLREEGSAAALLARFEAMRAFRESRPAAGRKALQLLGVAVAGIVLSLGAMGVSRPVGGGLFLVSLGLLVLAISRRVQAVSPLDSRAERFLGPFFAALGEDLGSRPVRLAASVAPLRSREFLQATEKRTATGYWNWTDRTYARELVTCACRLRDGSRIWLSVREKMVESTRKRWKGARKRKLKVKVRTRSTVSLVMRIAPPPGWQGGGVKIPFPPDCRIQWGKRGKARVVELRFREKIKGGEGATPERTLRLLQLVYQGFSTGGAAAPGGEQ
jgi:hypothetical protein